MARLGVVAGTRESAFGRLVADYLQDRRAAGASPKTVRIYADALEGVLLPFFAAREATEPAQVTNRLLNDLGAGLIDGSVSRTGRPLSKATVHSYMRAVNTFLVWAREEAGEAISARAKLPTMRKPVLEVLNRDEVLAMEDAAVTERDKLIVRLLFETGMRLGELLALTDEDLQSSGGRNVLAVRKGKGRPRPARAPLPHSGPAPAAIRRPLPPGGPQRPTLPRPQAQSTHRRVRATHGVRSRADDPQPGRNCWSPSSCVPAPFPP